MKKLFFLMTICVLFIFTCPIVPAGDKEYSRAAPPVEVPTSIPATVDNVTYIAGLSAEGRMLDLNTLPITLVLETDEFFITRPKTEKYGKASKIVPFEVCRGNYDKVIDVFVGDEAIKAVHSNKLPVSPVLVRGDGTSVPVVDMMLSKKDVRSSIIIHFVSNAGEPTALVLKMHKDKAEAVRNLILGQSKKGDKKK